MLDGEAHDVLSEAGDKHEIRGSPAAFGQLKRSGDSGEHATCDDGNSADDKECPSRCNNYGSNDVVTLRSTSVINEGTTTQDDELGRRDLRNKAD